MICQVFKPERAHHCSICNLCILNMDHHCPWVNNCIGFYNRKFFIQLLFYFFLTSFFLCITYIPYSFEIIKTIIETKGKGDFNNIYKNFLILLNNIVLLGFSIVDFNFTKYHIKLISSNLTTIETLDKELIKNKKYDLGFKKNFKQIFGNNKLLWFLPINLPIGYPDGDGLIWPKKDDIISLENIKNITNKENINNNIENKNNNNINTGITIIKNNSFGNKSPTRSSTLLDISKNNNKISGKYSKYNLVKRNVGNYNLNSTRYDSNFIKIDSFQKNNI